MNPEIEIAHIDRKSISFEKPTIVVKVHSGGAKQRQTEVALTGDEDNRDDCSPKYNSIQSIDSNDLQPQTTIALEEGKANSSSEVNELYVLATGTSCQHSGSKSNVEAIVKGTYRVREKPDQERSLKSKVSSIVAPKIVSSNLGTSRKSQIVINTAS